MIGLAHDCAVLGIPYDQARLFAEPPGDYDLALRLICERVSDTNRKENDRIEAQTR